MQNVIDKFQFAFAALGGFLGWFFGGFDGFLYALIIFVVTDYFTGILAAGIRKELSSDFPKVRRGAESRVIIPLDGGGPHFQHFSLCRCQLVYDKCHSHVVTFSEYISCCKHGHPCK